MDGRELLRRYCFNDPRLLANDPTTRTLHLDWRTAALVRIAALIAVSAPGASIQAAVDDAIAAGATSDEIVAVLDDVVVIVGLPKAIAGAPRLALALGYADDLTVDEEA